MSLTRIDTPVGHEVDGDPVAMVAPHAESPTVAVEIVVPVYNESAGLAASIERLHAYLDGDFPFSFQITIADNASTDDTWQLAQELSRRFSHVQARHLDQKGRGRALREVWSASDAAVLAYMDVDLSTDLAALLPLVAPLLTGHSDMAIGSRLSSSSRVVRGAKREVISRYVQPHPAHHPAGPVHRRAMRFQGDPGRRRPPVAPARAGHGLVLRHRTAGARRARRACVSTRCRSTGSTIPTAGSTSSRPRWPTCAASPGSAGRSRRASCPWPICALNSAARRTPPRYRECRSRSPGRPCDLPPSASRAPSPTWRCICCSAPRWARRERTSPHCC